MFFMKLIVANRCNTGKNTISNLKATEIQYIYVSNLKIKLATLALNLVVTLIKQVKRKMVYYEEVKDKVFV